jgi:hypothetical protein
MNIHIKAFLHKDEASNWIISQPIFNVVLAVFLLGYRLPISLQTGVIQGISAPVLYTESPTEFIVIAAIMGAIGAWFCFSAWTKYRKALTLLRAE